MFLKPKPGQAFFLILCAINLIIRQATAQVSLSNLSTSNPTNLSQAGLANQTQASQTQPNQFLISNSTTSPTSTNSTNNATTSSSIASAMHTSGDAVQLNTKITAPLSILGAFLIISGIPMAFWGGRNRWSCYFLTGAYVAALIVMIPILKFGIMGADRPPTRVIECVFVVICLLSAIGAGAVGVIFWKATGLRWVVILGGVSIAFVVATIPALTIHVTLFATAAVGAAAIVLGIDCFTTGGLKEFWLYIVGFGSLFPQVTYFPFTVTMQAELGLMGGLFVMGAAVQWRLLEYIKKKIDELKRLDMERKLQEEAAAYRQSMALDADLALWEKRHGDEADSKMVTVVDSATNPYHYRKNSQHSLGPLVSNSATAPRVAYHGIPSDSNEHLPIIDVGIDLGDSLDITEEASNLNLQPEKHKIATPGPVVSSINFEKSVNDRRFSRPPGAPSSWASPLNITKPDSRPASFPADNINQSELLLHHPSPAQLEEVPCQTPLPKFEPLLLHRPMSEHLTSRADGNTTNLETKRHSEVPSRVMAGSHQAPPERSRLHPKRESTIVTVEERDQRHKHAMKNLPLPVADKINSVLDHSRQIKEQHKRWSANTSGKNSDIRASAYSSTRNHERTRSSDLLMGKTSHQVSILVFHLLTIVSGADKRVRLKQTEHTLQPSAAISATNNPYAPTTSRNAHNINSGKSQATKGW